MFPCALSPGCARMTLCTCWDPRTLPLEQLPARGMQKTPPADFRVVRCETESPLSVARRARPVTAGTSHCRAGKWLHLDALQ